MKQQALPEALEWLWQDNKPVTMYRGEKRDARSFIVSTLASSGW